MVTVSKDTWVLSTEDFTDVILAIGDSYGDDVRGNGVGAGHGGWKDGAICWLNDGQIIN